MSREERKKLKSIDLFLDMHDNDTIMATENEKIKEFPLRLPIELHKQLEKRCKKSRRSVNSEIVILLERFIDSTETISEKEKIPQVSDITGGIRVKEKSPDPE